MSRKRDEQKKTNTIKIHREKSISKSMICRNGLHFSVEFVFLAFLAYMLYFMLYVHLKWLVLLRNAYSVKWRLDSNPM